MRFRYLALLFLVVVPAVYSQAQVAIGVQIGPSYGLYNPPPVCAWGYYPYYPFDCAPYGYWGPEWFAEGVFIGAGPWYRFYYVHPGLWVGFSSGPRFHRFHDFDRGFHRWDADRDFHRFDHDRFRGDRGFRRFDEDRGSRGWDRRFHGEFRGSERSVRGEGEREFRHSNRDFAFSRGFRGGEGGRGEFHGGGGRGGRHESRGGSAHGR